METRKKYQKDHKDCPDKYNGHHNINIFVEAQKAQQQQTVTQNVNEPKDDCCVSCFSGMFKKK